MRVAVAGASGFIGSHLCASLRGRGDDVQEISLRDPVAAARAAAGCDAVVNLAGEPIGRRWTAAVKSKVMESRTALPARFLEHLAAQPQRPKTYVSASAVGYYGTSETRTFTEADGPGDNFLAGVCVSWEQSAQYAKALGMRVGIVRTGLVLGTDGGALTQLLPLFKSGAGGRVGNGKQWYSWIHIDDAIGIYLLVLDRLEGTVNATAPNPVRNELFTESLARVLHRPAALPVPALAVKLALGEGAVMVLEGQRVLPGRALSEGYSFVFPHVEPALENLLAV